MLYKLAIEVFTVISTRDSKLLEKIETSRHEIYVKENKLFFTLPSLFEFCRTLYNTVHGLDEHISEANQNYLRFRSLLYQNPTNSILKTKGVTVELEHGGNQPGESVFKVICID